MDDLGFAGFVPFRAEVGPGLAERGDRCRRPKRLEACVAAAHATWTGEGARFLGSPTADGK